jgi:hypothetical protein
LLLGQLICFYRRLEIHDVIKIHNIVLSCPYAGKEILFLIPIDPLIPFDEADNKHKGSNSLV